MIVCPPLVELYSLMALLLSVLSLCGLFWEDVLADLLGEIQCPSRWDPFFPFFRIPFALAAPTKSAPPAIPLVLPPPTRFSVKGPTNVTF